MKAIRNRIKELRQVKASLLKPSPENWRTHPEAQQRALRGILSEVGYADALIARELEDGSLELIDGHCRADITEDEEVPVLVTDLDEVESRKLLAVLDPLSAMAGANNEKLRELLEGIDTDNVDLQELLDELTESSLSDEEQSIIPTDEQTKEMPAAMGIQPYEHYDYIVLFFRHSHDFMKACDMLKIQDVSVPSRIGSKRIGIGRAIDGKAVIEQFEKHNQVDHS